jgi:periplasmic divalent cation tolerance protein
MKLIYTTLNNSDEARKIGRELLTKNLANSVNFFPITCLYNYKDEITEEPEVVLIIKTKAGYYDKVKAVVKANIDYDNFIGELNVDNLNDDFSTWLNDVVK